MSEEKQTGKASPEAVTYIIMLSALQVLLECSLELENTPFMQGKVKEKVREAINMATLKNAKNRDKIWKVDEVVAANMSFAIAQIGKQIATGDGNALHLITKLVRDKYDLGRCVVTELTERQVKNVVTKMKQQDAESTQS
jgi:hypothetical protein